MLRVKKKPSLILRRLTLNGQHITPCFPIRKLYYFKTHLAPCYPFFSPDHNGKRTELKAKPEWGQGPVLVALTHSFSKTHGGVWKLMTGRKAAIPSQRTKSSSSATSSAEREPPVIEECKCKKIHM